MLLGLYYFKHSKEEQLYTKIDLVEVEPYSIFLAGIQIRLWVIEVQCVQEISLLLNNQLFRWNVILKKET